MANATSEGPVADTDFEYLPPPNVRFPADDDESDASQFDQPTIDYRSVYVTHSKHTGQPKIILPLDNIKVRIVSYQRSVTNMLKPNPNLYTLEVEHLNYKWILRRRYKHFQHLHNQLQLLRTSLNIPFPSKSHREQRTSFKMSRSRTRASDVKKFPRFPMVPEALVSVDQLEQRMQQLEEYMNSILENTVYRNHHETLSFLEVSRISFIDQLGDKRKEGWLKKRSGNNSSVRFNIYCREDDGEPCCCCYVFCCQNSIKPLSVWSRRWIFVKDSCVGYLKPETNEIGCLLLMDQDFKVRAGAADTGQKNGLIVSNSNRQLFVKNWTKREAQEWLDCIQEAMDSTGKDFIGKNNFGSFVPQRHNNKCTWFVDGSSYMSAVADAIESAKEEIMISDWWLSPEIYMKRPVIEGTQWRLDTILKRKAQEGVRIFVQLYKEVELALGINSFYSKKTLSSLHPNIKVLRHPDHVTGTATVLWAHHEKLVIIDQSVAFVGGIDLCYGRWDDEKHRLTDLGSVGATNRSAGVSAPIQSSHTMGQQVPGALFHLAKTANQVTLGTVTVETEAKPVKDRGKEVKQFRFEEPNQDEPAAINKKPKVKRDQRVSKMRRLTYRGREWAEELKGDGREWVERHFPSRMKDIKESSEIDSDEEVATTDDDLNLSSSSERQVDKGKEKENQVQEALTAFEGSTKLWIGKDYTNCIVKDFVKLDKPLQDFVDRTTTPRLPWHDIACAVWGDAARDVARHFIQRWNAIKLEKVKENNKYPFLMPKSYRVKNLHNHSFQMKEELSSTCDCQVLRSSTTWSVGSRTTEDSIQTAYVDAIKNSQHYIYIENQFFITLTGSSSDVSNSIGKALYERIVLAHQKQSPFRVIVILPLLPGFEGQIGTTTGVAMQAILHWNYASISRGNHSLLGRLRETKIDPLNYISFYGLRTHSKLNSQLVTELIYVHSKLMIVDDQIVICGSANINDRSLTGKRDSEVALITKDTQFVDSVMNGQPYKAGKYASSLRKRLFREHLGLLETGSNSNIDIDDPVSDSFYKETWLRVAALNTKIYEEVFRCLPCDEVTSFANLKEFQLCLPMALTEPTIAEEKLSQVQGHLVLLPLNFLIEENLAPAAGTAEALLPTSLWT